MHPNIRRARRAALGAVALPLLCAGTAMAAPSIAVDPAADLAHAGQGVSVTGQEIPLDTGTYMGPAAGYAGLYAAQIAIVDGTTFYANNEGSKYIRRTPSDSPNQAKLEDDGTFDTTITVAAEFASGDIEVDCAAANTDCFVASWPAHGNPTADNLIDSVAISFAPPVPAIFADPVSELDPGGETVSVAGENIPLDTGTYMGPAAGYAGLYAAQIAIVDGTTFYANNEGSKYIRRTPSDSPNQAKLEDDGTFDTTITVAAEFASGDTEVDCADANTECLIASWPAHGLPTADNLIDSLPIAFAADDPGPGGGGGGGGGGGTPATPAISFSPFAGLPVTGPTTVTVNGSGFSATANNGFGVYLVYGPRPADFASNAGIYGDSRWVHANGAGGSQAKMNADGTFSTTLTLAPSYVASNGQAVNCTVTQCYVMTFAAHGVPDRSFDTAVPVSFAGTADDPPAQEPPADPMPPVPPVVEPPVQPGGDTPPAGEPELTKVRLARNGVLRFVADQPGTVTVKVQRRTVRGKGKGRKVRWRRVGRKVEIAVEQGSVVRHALRLRKPGRYRAKLRFVGEAGGKATASTAVRVKADAKDRKAKRAKAKKAKRKQAERKRARRKRGRSK